MVRHSEAGRFRPSAAPPNLILRILICSRLALRPRIGRTILRQNETGSQHSEAEKTRSEPPQAVFTSVTGCAGCPLSSTRMQFHTEHLTFNTKKHREYINITAQVDSALRKSGIREGMILVSAMHITAGVWVNDAEDGLIADIDEWLEKLAPYRENYRHHRTGETNGDSHLKSLLVHHQVIVPVTAGKLDLDLGSKSTMRNSTGRGQNA